MWFFIFYRARYALIFWNFCLILIVLHRKDGGKLLVLSYIISCWIELTEACRAFTHGKVMVMGTESMLTLRTRSITESNAYRQIIFIYSTSKLGYQNRHWVISTSEAFATVSNFFETWLMKLSNSPRSFPSTQLNSSIKLLHPPLCRSFVSISMHRSWHRKAGV